MMVNLLSCLCLLKLTKFSDHGITHRAGGEFFLTVTHDIGGAHTIGQNIFHGVIYEIGEIALIQTITQRHRQAQDRGEGICYALTRDIGGGAVYGLV